MKYKALMLDLDDTTVVHGKLNVPSARVTQAIQSARKYVDVCIATARTLPDTHLILDHLGLTSPCVLTNGTQVYDPVKKIILHEVEIPHDVVTALARQCRDLSLHAKVFDGTRDCDLEIHEHPSKMLSIYIPEVPVPLIDDYVKIFSIDPRIHVQKLSAWNKDFMSLDITSTQASKLHGVSEVAKILNISTTDMIGVGDGYNDFPLLLACGLKIAMGNAVSELKEIADFVAPTVYEDGVAVVIEKFILERT